MPDFGRNALTYSYSWGEAELSCCPAVICPDDIIDRSNGYHILGFINRFMMQYGLISQESVSRAESLIYHHMPKHICTRNEMKQWLSQNWNKRI